MATKTKTKVEEPKEKDEDIKEPKNDIQEPQEPQEPDNQDNGSDDDNSDNGKNEPEVKESFGTKMKKLGGKIKSGAKKALPYVGAFAAGAGAAVGALIVMTKPDGTEYDLLTKNDDLVPAEDFIDGEASVVEESTEDSVD